MAQRPSPKQKAADLVLTAAVRKSIQMLSQGSTAENVRPVLYRAEIVAQEVLDHA